MNTESFARTKFGRLFVKLMARVMESRFRYRFFGPERILEGADIQPGQVVLEIGCGTGYFTLPAARLTGENGYLVAMDVLSESVEFVSKRAEEARLKNVKVIKGDAMNTGLDSERFDIVLLFGLIPAPMLPLSRLLPEMHRVLRPEGRLAIWPPIPGWLPGCILKSDLFTLISKRNGVYIFRRYIAD